MTSAAFRFRLETVLRVRRVEETRAKEVFAAATREVARRSARARLARSACDALPDVLPAMTADEFEAFRQRAAWLAHAAAAAVTALELAAAEHALAREQMISARQRVEALERLADRRRHEWVDASVRAEALELDNVVAARVAAGRIEAGERRVAP
jgi:flagellar export protein FliJ